MRKNPFFPRLYAGIPFCVLYLLCILSLSCDSVDDTDYIIPNITEREAWLTESFAWKRESEAIKHLSVSYDTLSALLKREGYGYDHWDSIRVIIPDLEDAIAWANDLHDVFSDSSDYFLLQSDIATIFADTTLCFPHVRSRWMKADRRKESIMAATFSIEENTWFPAKDLLVTKLNIAQYSWARSSNDWQKLERKNYLVDWESVSHESCTAETLELLGLIPEK